jgi:hypothetical protein
MSNQFEWPKGSDKNIRQNKFSIVGVFRLLGVGLQHLFQRIIGTRH